MGKIPMRVVEPPKGTDRLHEARGHAGAVIVKGVEGKTSFVCGQCRSVLLKSVGADRPMVHGPEDERGHFPPLYSVREAVFRCKSCGAYNELAD